MRTLESFYKGPGWQRSGSDLRIGNGRERDLNDATKQISKMLGEEWVRELKARGNSEFCNLMAMKWRWQ